MTTYKEQIGTNIEVVSSDPSNPLLGQVWYNTTTQTLKALNVTTSGSWSSGGSLNTARSFMAGTGASNTAALAFGGTTGPLSKLNESYNGTSFTEVNDLNTARAALGGAGTQTSTLAFGGNLQNPTTFNLVESWNGTNWTEVADLNTARSALSGAGTQAATLAFGGELPSVTAASETWNGVATVTIDTD